MLILMNSQTTKTGQFIDYSKINYIYPEEECAGKNSYSMYVNVSIGDKCKVFLILANITRDEYLKIGAKISSSNNNGNEIFIPALALDTLRGKICADNSRQLCLFI